MERFSLRRFGLAAVTFAGVLGVGTVGFRLILDEGWVSSFYRSVVTTTLTGLDSAPRGGAGMLFSVALLLAGVAIFLYLAGTVVELITRGVVQDMFGERRRRRAIAAMENHTIICGFGRVGRSIAAEFDEIGAGFVVLDPNHSSVIAARERGASVIEGDGTEDSALESAGIMRARALVVCADSDESNVFITLSARAARPDLFIVARASDAAAAKKLRLAGADRVVEPYSSAGLRIANLVLKPQVSDFLDIVSTAAGEGALRLEEIEVQRGCPSGGQSIGALRVRDATGAMIVAIRKQDGTFETSPSPRAVLDEGDVLIGVGTPEQIGRLEDLFAPGSGVPG